MKTKLVSLLILFVIASSCTSECKINAEIATMPLDVSVVRFDKIFAETTVESLPNIKTQFPELFAPHIPDSIWVSKLSDTLQQEINAEVDKIFPVFTKETQELTLLFKHIKYYFPEFRTPEVITVTSDVDWRNKVILADKLLLIALDTYLGKDHHFYVGIQQYLVKNFRRSQLYPDVARAYASQLVTRPMDRSFLAYLIYYGKQIYLESLFLPCTNNAEYLGYTDEEFQFAVENEDQVWRYFIEKELLYKTDNKLQERFLNEGPFSKFYLQLDSETPAKLGQFIGWQIVKQYMDKNNISIKKMLITDAQTIFKDSKYKPKK